MNNTSNDSSATSVQGLLLSAAAQIISNYVVSRPDEKINLAELAAQVCATLAAYTTAASKQDAAPKTVPIARPTLVQPKSQPAAPAVSISESIKPDYLVCLENGERVKMLKRYLMTNFQLTPEQYRARWNLPKDYPMVAPNYAKMRSKLAKEIGLGKKSAGRRKLSA